ncbi:43kDa postsynaptic protein [Parasponia andersonii]|uniref:RING-type E3 ubiquitin transferase n=1 Tax=Parasponia andersonii TaxID=3476 RepID=A0A2P5AL06_PARAD|nr:43kDa postsynaptic protein [Parasponia andersonii]
MEESMASRYWCHMCSQIVNPIMEIEIKCPFCQSGFVEEMTGGNQTPDSRNAADPDSDFGGSDRALSLWAPILLGMMGHPRRRRRFRRVEFDEDDDDDDGVYDGDNEEREARHGGGDTELDRELESFIRRRRRSSATVLQLLQGIRAGLASESLYSEGLRDRDRDSDERERVILINPFNQTVLVQGQNDNQNPIGSLGDYFIGPGLDLLLQHLAENDPNRYGTPPAKKEAVEALPTVAIKENLQCSVCLDDFEAGAEAKEMPCKHKFHSECILPWLGLHSSCPVCRFQLSADESKRDSDGSRNGNIQRAMESENSHPNDGDGRNGSNGRRFSFPWPFSGLFSASSSSGSQSSGGNSSSPSSSSSTTGNGSGSGNGFQANEN